MKITFPTGIIYLLLVLAITMLFSSCASIFKGNFEKVNFYSNPSGGEVYINGQFAGVTPLLDVKLRSNLPNYTYTIEIRKKGFYPYKTTINTKLHAGYVALDIIALLPTGALSILIDAAEGSWNTFDENYIRTILRNIPD